MVKPKGQAIGREAMKRVSDAIGRQDRAVRDDKKRRDRHLDRDALKADVEAWLAQGNRIEEVDGYTEAPAAARAVGWERWF